MRNKLEQKQNQQIHIKNPIIRNGSYVSFVFRELNSIQSMYL